MSRVFEARNIGQRDSSSWDFEDQERRPHSSPIVSAFAPRGYGIQDDLYVLFIAEYLRNYLPDDADLGHKATMVADQISRYIADAQNEETSVEDDG